MEEVTAGGLLLNFIGHLVAEVVGVDGEVEVRVAALCGQQVVEFGLQGGKGGSLVDSLVPAGEHDVIPGYEQYAHLKYNLQEIYALSGIDAEVVKPWNVPIKNLVPPKKSQH